MSDNSVVIQMSAQDAELVAAWQRARQGPQAMGDELENAGKKGKKAADEVKGAFDTTIPTFGQLAVAATGVGSVMAGLSKVSELISAEWNDILARMKEAAGIQIGIAGAQRKAFENLGTKSDISRGELAELVQGQSKIPLAEQWQAVAAGLKEGNESTGFSQRRAAMTGIEAGRLAPGIDAAERDALTSAAVELQQGDDKLTPGQAVAQVRRFQRKSESTGMQVNQALTTGIGHVQELAPGTSAGDAAGFLLGIQKQANLGDIGAAVSVAEKLLVGLDQAGAKGNLNERIAQIAKSKKLSAAAIKATSKNKEAYATMQQLGMPGSEALQTIARMQGELGGDAATIEAEEAGLVASIEREPGQLAATAERKKLNAHQRWAAMNPALALREQATAREAEAWRDAGIGGTARTFSSGLRTFGGMFQSDDEKYVRGIAESLDTTAKNILNQESVEILREARDEIMKMAEDIKRLADQKNQTQSVRVESLPADTKPSGTPASGVSD